MNKWTERGVILVTALAAGLGLGWMFGYRYGQNTTLTETENMLRKHGLLDGVEGENAKAPADDQAVAKIESSDAGAPDAR